MKALKMFKFSFLDHRFLIFGVCLKKVKSYRSIHSFQFRKILRCSKLEPSSVGNGNYKLFFKTLI